MKQSYSKTMRVGRGSDVESHIRIWTDSVMQDLKEWSCDGTTNKMKVWPNKAIIGIMYPQIKIESQQSRHLHFSKRCNWPWMHRQDLDSQAAILMMTKTGWQHFLPFCLAASNFAIFGQIRVKALADNRPGGRFRAILIIWADKLKGFGRLGFCVTSSWPECQFDGILDRYFELVPDKESRRFWVSWRSWMPDDTRSLDDEERPGWNIFVSGGWGPSDAARERDFLRSQLCVCKKNWPVIACGWPAEMMQEPFLLWTGGAIQKTAHVV